MDIPWSPNVEAYDSFDVDLWSIGHHPLGDLSPACGLDLVGGCWLTYRYLARVRSRCYLPDWGWWSALRD